jgi:hypothetical protein
MWNLQQQQQGSVAPDQQQQQQANVQRPLQASVLQRQQLSLR